MKRISILFLLTLFMSMMGINAFAYDIRVENADGATIYYNYINDKKELEVTYYDNHSKYSKSATTYVGDVVIPEEVTYYNETRKVTSIGYCAFMNCTSLTSVTIPNGVKAIGEAAFKWCTSLTSVTIPSSVKDIRSGAFWECTSLTSITIPDGVKHIGERTFWCCKSLTSVTIPSSVTVIYDEAFRACSSLTSVTIPNSVKSILDGAFCYCSSLTSVEIPSSVEYIYYAAFSNCRSLTSVTIPSSVKDIGSYAFNGPKLSTIVSLIEDPSPIVIVGKGQIWSTFSDDTFTKATLYVPAGSVEKYKTTYGWKDFGHIVPLDEGMSVKVMESDNDSPSEYFLLNGQQVDQPQKGLTIVKTGKKAVKVLVK